MTLQESDFAFVRDFVLSRSAIVLEQGKEYLVEARLAPVARDAGLSGIPALVEQLRRQPSGALATRVVEAMTTNETSFFRDSHPFDALKSTIIPTLLERNRADRTINIWSAACSTGQEPYTIAMTLRENFPQLDSWKVRIVATDLAEHVLDRARAGRYRQLEVNRGLPALYLTKYFTRHGLDWEVTPALKQWTEFRQLNLIGDWGVMPRFDVVFLRNVLIYFDLDTKRKILGKVRRTMSRDGWLFLGSAETTLNIDEAFRRVHADRGHAYQNAA
ncbi:MAG: protein-glutamate O-methyltransferase CheR [Sandaracinaceae bacterium]|jgi:chemotaxis protein methyltransferase CheR|nr:protein-glutamate O-methyltransferase CheR [Sandaracinaceae bacterium]